MLIKAEGQLVHLTMSTTEASELLWFMETFHNLGKMVREDRRRGFMDAPITQQVQAESRVRRWTGIMNELDRAIAEASKNTV
jgi:hypothetical protein